MIFNQHDYAALHAAVFRPDYPGYKPDVIESPNSDGVLDVGKRYAHVSLRYLEAWNPEARRDRALKVMLKEALHDAFDHAYRLCGRLGVPRAYKPSLGACALRVLEYPPGVGGNLHTDFDLFTTLCYRNDDQGLRRVTSAGEKNRLDAIDPGLHLGRIGELVGLGRATPHRVWDFDWVQHSIVFFALPSHDALLPPTPGYQSKTVGEWLEPVIAASRASAGKVGAP